MPSFAIAALIALSLSPVAPVGPQDARQMVDAALEQMGGKARLASVCRVTASGLTVQNLLEQSVRFEGPYVQNLFDFEEVCDYNRLTHQVKIKARGAQFADWFTAEFTYGFKDGLTRKGMPLLQTPQESIERLSLSPERVLLLADLATDLQAPGDITINKIPHRQVRFTVGKTSITVAFSRHSQLPTVIETRSTRQGFWQVWGDVTTRAEYGSWQLLPGKFRYPHLQTVQRNSLPQSVTTLTKVILETAPDRGLSAVQEETKALLAALQAFPAQRIPPFAPVTVMEGILQYPGMFQTQVVSQSDGLVIIEAVNTSAFNEALLVDLKQRFPGKPIKAVIVTDDAWPHCGGIRPYIARNIPVYAPAENRAILEKLAKASFTLSPDAQEKARRPLRFQPVAEPVTVGSGPNRLQIYPLRGVESERMCAVYFPERKLLYGSDLVQVAPDGSLYSPELARELIDRVNAEKIEVETLFAMHSAPISWKSFVDAYARSLEQKNTP